MNDFIQAWCKDKHERIDRELRDLWDKCKSLDNRLWAIIVLLVGNFAAAVVILIRGG